MAKFTKINADSEEENEVELETQKEWIRVRVHDTDIEGWIQKKYTRQPR